MGLIFHDDAEVELIRQGLHALLTVKQDALQTVTAAHVTYNGKPFTERDFGIPNIQAIIDRIQSVEADPERDAKYISAAKAAYYDEGVCEIDDRAIVSYGKDFEGGAYVQAWVWIEAGAVGDAEPTDDDCTCDERSWHGEEHDSACPLAGKPRTEVE